MDEPWFIDYVAPDGTRVRHWIRQLPFRVGRDAGNDLHLEAQGLSRRHAEFGPDISGRLRLTDLGSTNGSFVNRAPIHGSCLLAEDDVIHLGHFECRLGRGAAPAALEAGDEPTMVVGAQRALPQNFVPHERQFFELLAGTGLSGAAQPIVDAAGGGLVAYELLGRGNHPDLPASPIALFLLAARLDREVELSAAFRQHGVRAIAPRLGSTRLFVNTHPKETFTDAFVDAVTELRRGEGSPELVVEIHEAAVVEIEQMRRLAARLAEIGVEFAYDDFGAGQARINELAEVPPHYVKFDMALIREIHRASERKQRVVRDLVRVVRDLGSQPLAEGVEFEADARVCREMGFALLQGWFTGRPVPLAEVATADRG
jgi:EAL domain-containing protein (putative c-di-GMP-specific phosphodiesterase class I)